MLSGAYFTDVHQMALPFLWNILILVQFDLKFNGIIAEQSQIYSDGFTRQFQLFARDLTNKQTNKQSYNASNWRQHLTNVWPGTATILYWVIYVDTGSHSRQYNPVNQLQTKSNNTLRFGGFWNVTNHKYRYRYSRFNVPLNKLHRTFQRRLYGSDDPTNSVIALKDDG